MLSSVKKRTSYFALIFVLINLIVSIAAQGQVESDSFFVQNVDDSSVLAAFPYLEGFKQINFDIQSSEPLNKDVQKEDVSVDGVIQHKYSLFPLEVETSYEQIDTSFFNVDTRPIKQTYIIRNQLDKPQDITINLKYEIDASTIIWNNKEYPLADVSQYFADETPSETTEPSSLRHTLYFGKSYYDFSDVVGLNSTVSAYIKEGKNYIDLEIQANIGAQERFVIDPVLGWTTRLYSGGAGGGDIYAIDINKDNDIDIVAADHNGGELSWYENNGGSTPSFSERAITTTANQLRGIFPIDLNNDGNIDIVSAIRLDNVIAWYKSDGSNPPLWANEIISTGVNNPHDVYAIDIDNDGDIDVLSASFVDDKIAWYENNGGSSPSWTARTISTAADGATSVFAIDINNDGYIDVLSASQNDDKIAWYENNGGNPPSWTARTISTTADEPTAVFAIDINSDGKVDVLSTSHRDGKLVWYENNGGSPPTWTERIISTAENQPQAVFAVDIDKDNDVDVVSASNQPNDHLNWYESNGGSPPSWTKHTISTTASTPRSVHAADIDNDADIDVVAGSSQQEWYQSSLNPNVCTGTLQTIVQDASSKSIGGIKVYLESVLQGTTDSFGILNVNTPSATCSQQQTLEVKCSDDRFCASKEISIDFPNEFESATFDCTLCLSIDDLVIGQQDVTITSSGAQSTINATVHSVNIAANNNLTVRFQTIGTDGLIKDTTDKTITLTANGQTSTTATFDLSNKDFVTVYVDPTNKFLEQKTNNFVRRSTIKRMKAYMDINTGFSKADEAIQEFLEAFIEPVSESQANIILAVGRLSTDIVNDIIDNQNFMNTYGWGSMSKNVFAGGQFLSLPYNGVVGSYVPSYFGKLHLVALGADIDGTIAAVKRMASAAGTYFNGIVGNKPLIILDRYDLTALGVYDILHNAENINAYRKNTDNFKTAVAKTLGGNTYDVAIRLVNTTTAGTNVTIRVKNVNSEFSQFYKDAVIQDPTPVIFSGGLFSDLERWEEKSGFIFTSKGLATQIAEEGRDSWEIEITGGPLIERPTDPDYTYNDLVDAYWPASIAAIQYYTGKISTDYVGHSNGCRVALSSLEKYQQVGKNFVAKVQNLQTGNYLNVHLQGSSTTPIVDTFVGVGCPGAFEGNFPILSLPWAAQTKGSQAIANLEQANNNHPTFAQLLRAIILVSPSTEGTDGKISLNLFKDYKNIIDNQTDLQPGNFSVNKALIVYGNVPAFPETDFVVTVNDNVAIYNNLISTNKDLEPTALNHLAILGDSGVKQKIKEKLGG